MFEDINNSAGTSTENMINDDLWEEGETKVHKTKHFDFEKKSFAREANVSDDEIKMDYKTIDDQTDGQPISKNDLCDLIPGLYRLLDLCKDEGTNGLVDKVIISQQHIEKFCNEMVANSFKSIAKIRYDRLNSRRFHLIGCYGRNELIAKLLLGKAIINQSTYELLIHNDSNAAEATLSPGIYIQKLPSDNEEHNFDIPQFLLIHWSEDGCYEDSASSYQKKNMTNLHRYLTKLCEHQICLMSDKDLACINWQKLDVDDDDDDEAGFIFEVKKRDEKKRNFELFPGFDLYHEKLVDHDGSKLSPLVVESVSNPMLITREMLRTERISVQNDKVFDSEKKFQEYFQQKLKTNKYSLLIDSKVTMAELEIIVNDGLKLPNLLIPYHSDLKAHNEEKNIETHKLEKKLQDDMSIVNKIACKILEETYKIFEKPTSSKQEENSTLDDKTVERINQSYAGIQKEICEAISYIDHAQWNDYKARFIFVQDYSSNNSISNNSISNNSISNNHEPKANVDIFSEKDISSLIGKYTINTKDQKFFKKLANYIKGGSNVDDIVLEVKDQAKKIKDNEFVQEISKNTVDDSEYIIQQFYKCYQDWKKSKFPKIINSIIQKYEDEIKRKSNQNFETKLEPIYKKNFQLICDQIESNCSTGNLLKVLGVKITEGIINKKKYELNRIIKVPQLCVTIYNSQFSQEDMISMSKDESFIPKPILQRYGKHSGISFEIDPEIYEFKHIVHIKKKFLVFLWNKVIQGLEIYFGSLLHLRKTIQAQEPLKKLNSEKNFMIAVNEPKALIALYDIDMGMLNSYLFEDHSNINLAYRNIQIKQWYNENVPNIAHFFFVKNTDKICFVESNGRARIYSLVNNDFYPGVAQFPNNTFKAMSSPDGTCIVAFVKEKSKEDSSPTNYDMIDVIRGDVYFTENFSQNADIVIKVPFKHASTDFQFSTINDRQLHLTTIDKQGGSFQSLMVKITHAKINYRFERQLTQKDMGKVRIQTENPFIIIGGDTKFSQDLYIGDFIIIGNEKREVIKIMSDIELKISGQSFKSVEYDKWHPFMIEKRKTSNGLIDVYSLVFTKYAISSPIGKVDNQLAVTIVIDSENLNIEDEYKEKFQKYFIDMFKKLKKETSKPIGHLKKFKTDCRTFKSFNDLTSVSTEYQLGEWLIDFFCLIPLQIAVTRDNKFIPLRDGILLPEVEQTTLDNLSNSISFGWYEAIFDYYTTLEVKVISSMGEQSCGKSYLLNHCIGSTFDGSAMRCTEGVWMSLVKTNNTLYVALDFEGLASIERTAQEETYLQLLNAALSNLVLFKSQFAISRDISSMFQRFHDGVNYFGNDPDIFQACFCIIIKDVAISDRDDIVEEFQTKLSKIVSMEEENNFITKLYRNKMCIIPWPVITDASFYKSIRELKKQLDEQDSKYKNARMFLEKIKVLMRNLKEHDWGSIQETIIIKRTSELKRFLNNVISFGYEQKDDDQFSVSDGLNDITHLTSRDDGKQIPDDKISLSEVFNDIKSVDLSTKLMPDAGLQLFKDKGDFVEISSGLRSFFEQNIYARGSIPDSEWLELLEKHFKFFVNRRIKRVQEWITQNISSLPKDHNEVSVVNYVLNQEISKLTSFWNICRLSCNKCNQACLKASRHDIDTNDAHDCLTNHLCHSLCHCIRDHSNGLIPKCVKIAGHKDRHECDEIHRCDAPCIYSKKRNCKKICMKDYDHHKAIGNERHLCDSTIHYCEAPCSLDVETQKGKHKCQNTCIAKQHTIHKCHANTCPIVCYVKNCEKICENSDHLHAFGKSVNHICGTCHFRCDKCNKTCQKANRHAGSKFSFLGQIGGHDCLTDHKCHAKCQFPNSDAHLSQVLPECNLFADHEGMHRCVQMHSCEAPCVHADKKNCQKRCAKNALHPTNEKHLCEVKEHYCGAPCSLDVKIHGHKCQNTCIIPCEEEHTIHKCQDEMCPIKCSFENCKRFCESLDHLHAFKENANHICGHCHSKCDKCGQMCRKADQHKDGIHDCFTDHKCHSKCEISGSHTNGIFPECDKPALHQGKHQCDQFHKCNAPCIYTGKRNCKSKCVKVFGHQEKSGNEAHLCESSNHYCGAPCSLIFDTINGKYYCPDICILTCEKEHTLHRCLRKKCPVRCSIEGCKKFCENSDHLHALDKKTDHLCGLCHSQCDKCGQMCRRTDQHSDDGHDCLTDHKCHSPCQIVGSHTDKIFPECNKPAAHQGNHKCGQFHKCNARCFYMGKKNCLHKCAKVLGHEDETHLCESNNHCCGAQCSLLVDTLNEIYKCNGVCNIACEKEHTTHKCQSNKCPVECSNQDCGKPCNFDHFHGFEQNVDHHCGLCHSQCDINMCGLLCRKTDHHDQTGHNCLTDHLCHLQCQFVHFDGTTQECNKFAAHRGPHKCPQIHPCNGFCVFSDKRNCRNTCANTLCHRGEHLCKAKKHYCGVQCTSSDNCRKICILSVEKNHTTHQCRTHKIKKYVTRLARLAHASRFIRG
ncbi:hypothetical protein Glove_535g6 [Diversispora epigaea]|uniref:VWFA domain-containing protein n=1 Tax=Diversispora epigaea TaxID=1348612 RepID=A0A397GIW8_9GLOM|nr:hypothetical protein Glove_535g6 [Diversispora epigaea]